MHSPFSNGLAGLAVVRNQIHHHQYIVVSLRRT